MQGTNFEIDRNVSYSYSRNTTSRSDSSIFSIVSKIFKAIGEFFSRIVFSVRNFFFPNISERGEEDFYIDRLEPSAPPFSEMQVYRSSNGEEEMLPVARSIQPTAINITNARPY